MGWGGRLLIGLALVILGAAAATWSLARYQTAARFLGVTQPIPAVQVARQAPAAIQSVSQPSAQAVPQEDQRLTGLETRIARVEHATERAEGSAGRADALVVAFAARRAIDRGVALGYLENLLVGRFGQQHQRAVATIVTASHQPVLLNDLIARYDALGPDLKRGGPGESWWTGVKRELGSLVQVHSAKRPSANPDARYQRAAQWLASGEVDRALAETMRMPGANYASDWIARARRYIAVHRALDEIESAALLPQPSN
jgi:hypothetical protein